MGPADIVPIEKLIAWAKKTYPINPRRVYMFGKGEGGKISAEFTMLHPDVVTAAITYSWGFWVMPSEINDSLDPDKSPEIYMNLGMRDLATHLTTVRDTYPRVKAKGYNVIYREFEDMGSRSYYPPSNDDAIAWATQLRGDSRFNKVFILGHSEGSLIGILAAKQVPVDGLVSVSGSGRELAALLRDQLKRNLPANLFEQSSHMIDELVAGRRVKDVPPELTILFRPSVQPFLMTWSKYDPAKEIAGLKIPILVVQGTTDLQISIEDAKLLAGNNKNARLVTIENMNHVLKNAPSQSLLGQAKAYSDPAVPLEPRLMEEVVGFVQKN